MRLRQFLVVLLGILALCYAAYSLAFLPHTFPRREHASALERDLIEASFDGNIEKVKTCLANGARLDARYGGDSKYFTAPDGGWPLSGMNWTALMAATENDHFEIVEFLVAKGASVRMDDGWGMTPLYMLADKPTPRRQYDMLAALLLIKGADPNATTDVYIDGPGRETVLHRAVGWGHVEIVKMLIAAGAHINAKTTHGETPLDYVIEGRNDQAISKILTAAGGRVGDARD